MNICQTISIRSAAWVALAATSSAQFYWPAGSASTAGNAVMNAPFTSQPGHQTTSTRCVVILDPASLPFPVGTVLNRLSLRRDVSYPNQAYGGATGSLFVRIGRAPSVPDQTHDVRFSRLWEGPPTTVFDAVSTPFVIPAAPAPGSTVPPFSIVIPFTTNYTWQGGPLAIELLWTPTSGSSAWRIDAFARPRPQSGTFRPAGAGCQGSNGFTPLHYALPETTMPGAVLTVQMEGSRLPPSPGSIERFAFHVLGLQNSTYQGQPLPISLAGSGGLPGCFLRVDPLLTFTVPVSNPSALFARATSNVALPAHPALVGMVLYSQWLMFDTGYNVPLPIIVSDAQAITLGQVAQPAVPHAAMTIWKYGARRFGSDTGNMVPDDYGPALRFN